LLETPILFLTYNRPGLTRQVLATIREAQPKQLFIAADGPKPGKTGDCEQCQAVRNALRDGIDWDCEVNTLLRDENLGCKRAVSSAITWFFDHAKEGIILEDDTLPRQSFFRFCEELLDKYRNTTEILHISGDNFQQGRKRGLASYYFSMYNHIWGWATWRRAWRLYDVEMKSFPAFKRNSEAHTMFRCFAERDYWLHTLQRVYEGQIDTWDFQWTFAVWLNRGLCILPNVNLVSNIGFGGDATHTSSQSQISRLPSTEIGRLTHPRRMVQHRKADAFTFNHIFQNGPEPLVSRFKRLLFTNRFRRKLDLVVVRRQQQREIERARKLVNRSESDAAFAILNALKGQRARVQEIDYLRALCFVARKESLAAIEALKEELRYFPENQQAGKMLADLLTRNRAESQLEDAEFLQILEVIRPYTMVGEGRLLSLFRLAKGVCEEDLPGNFVECGVAAGGSSALLATVIARHSKRPRKLYSFDTFEGMPEASALDLHAGKSAEETGWGAGTCSAPQASLRDVSLKLGVEDLVEPIKGLFADTLPANRARIGQIAFIHLDGDWYHSTREILNNLFDAVSAGAPLQVDDYGYWDGCKRAIAEFQHERGLNFELNEIDGIGVWFLKE
jgi:Macrocin-O-methyltransferase (TylF)